MKYLIILFILSMLFGCGTSNKKKTHHDFGSDRVELGR
jgi:hypothetical protein